MDNPLPDATAPNTVLFFALTAHIADGTPDDLNDCWCTLQQLHTPFYNSDTTKCEVQHYILYNH